MNRRLLVLGLLLLCPWPAAAADPPVRATSTVDRTAAWVADRVTFTVDIVCDRGVDILLDDLAKEKLRVNGLDIVGSDSSATTDAAERTTHRLRYVLTTYRVDLPAVSIEPISVRYYARRPGQRLQDMAPAGEVVVPGAVVAYRSTLPDTQPVPGLRDRRAAATAESVLRARAIDGAGAGRRLARPRGRDGCGCRPAPDRAAAGTAVGTGDQEGEAGYARAAAIAGRRDRGRTPPRL